MLYDSDYYGDDLPLWQAVETGAGVVPDLVCGDYWLINNEPGSMNDFFTITMSQNAQFRLGVITDCTPNNPDGLLWEAATGVQIVSNTGADSGLIEVVGPNESWRNADVDYVLFDINGSVGEVYTVKGRYDGRWEANALGGVFFDPSGSDDFVITAISRDPNTGNVTVTFTSKSGVDYALQASTDMAAGTWTEVLDETGQSGTTTVVDSIVAPTAGPVFFYRVVNLDEFEE